MNGISVIIPVYNGAPMLAGCLGSVTGTRVREIIVVDDGSTDNTLAEARRLATVDARMRVIHTGNRGIYAARRTGVAASTQPYIAFMDADDRFCAGALDRLADLLEAHGTDVAMGGIVRTTSLDAPEPVMAAAPEVHVWTAEQMWLRIMRWKTKEFINYTVNKLYRRELLVNLADETGFCEGEDVLITCQAFLKARSCVETAAPVYLYYQNPESVTHRRFGVHDPELIRVWDAVVALMPEGRLRHMARVNRWRTDYTLIMRLILADDRETDERYAKDAAVWRRSLAQHWQALLEPLPPNRKALVLALRFAYGPTKALLRLGGRTVHLLKGIVGR